MSHGPTIGGKLREGTSGVDRSQAGYAFWGDRPRQGGRSDLRLNVIMGRPATPDRSLVTAVKYVYSTWKFTRPGERNGKRYIGIDLHRNQFTCCIRLEGENVQKLLTQLSVYTGHAQVAATQLYLTMTPELLQRRASDSKVMRWAEVRMNNSALLGPGADAFCLITW